MKKRQILLVACVLLFSLSSFAQIMKEQTKEPIATSAPSLPKLQKMIARFAPIQLQVDVSGLSAGDRKAIAKLIEASRIVDDIQLEQRWKGNEALYTQLSKEKSALGKARLHYFWINKGPWSVLDENMAFIPGVPERKPLGANFYPEDATKEEL